MLKVQLILTLLCAQVFLLHCYTINHLQRPLWPELESEANEELLAKLLHAEAFLNEANPTVVSSPVALFDQAEGHPRGLQKRGRQCLWKVCSWALDKRSLRSMGPSSSSNSVDALSKLFY